MKILIFGAGVIGQIYGGRLTQAGHDVTMLARGRTAESLAEHGIALRTGDRTLRAQPPVVTGIAAGSGYDLTLVCVRADQLAAALTDLSQPATGQVVFLLNQCTGLQETRDRVGGDRTLFGFPGVAGYRLAGGTIEYLDVPQQHTTIERRNGREQPIVRLLRGAGFRTAVSADIDGWLKTHAVFITALAAAVLAAGGDSAALAADRARVADAVVAIGEGFRALTRLGTTVTPVPLRYMFTAMPRFVAVRYWQRLLRGPVGTIAITPHLQATRGTELVWLSARVRQILAAQGPTPRLEALFSSGFTLNSDRS